MVRKKPPITQQGFSPTETSVKIGVSPSHVFNLIHAGKLPHIKLGARYIISQKTIDRILEEGIT